MKAIIQELCDLMDEAGLVVLLCHHNADPDAVCAAFALSGLLKRLRPEISVEIAAPQGASRLSKSLLNSLRGKLTRHPRIKEAGLIVLLDTNTIQQLDEWGELVKSSHSPIVVVDHHAIHPEMERLATICIIYEEAPATCQIVYRLFEEMEVEPTEIEAKALFLGIAFDTKKFVLANSATFKTVVKLIDAGIDPKETLSSLSLPMDFSERVARLKACQRTKLTKINEWLIALSNTSSYQASAARALIYLGAHVAVVAGKKGNAVQISLRSQSDFFGKTGIHLGRDIANPLGECLRGMGGGHSTAAGVNGVGDVEASLKRCTKLLKEKITCTPSKNCWNV